jgi:hypothetical protein
VIQRFCFVKLNDGEVETRAELAEMIYAQLTSAGADAVVGLPADDSAARIQMIATLLRKLDCAAAFEVLVPFLDNSNFYVRWHIMRELLGLDAAAALPYLERMAANDPHDDNVRAAQSVLDRIATKSAEAREAA